MPFGSVRLWESCAAKGDLAKCTFVANALRLFRLPPSRREAFSLAVLQKAPSLRKLASCRHFDKLQFAEAYAADESYRSLAPLGMPGTLIGVIPNAVRDLYIAISAYIALCEKPAKSQLIGMYAADITYRSLTLR